MQKQDEIAFAKQLNDFEASMQKDLNQRSSEIAKKWEFDFSLEKPLESATNDAASMKKMQWEPVHTEVVESIQATRPRL